MPKPRLCRCGCKAIIPANNQSINPAATLDCALKLIATAKAKQERKALSESRKQTRADRARIKTRGEWMKEAQIAFNAYIRARDYDKPCIDCGKWHKFDQLTGGEWDCGHYRSVGSCPELRFEPLNAARQLKACNRFLSGRAVDYRLGLIARIGLKKVEWLEASHPPKKYSVDDLKEIKAQFTKMRKALEIERL